MPCPFKVPTSKRAGNYFRLCFAVGLHADASHLPLTDRDAFSDAHATRTLRPHHAFMPRKAEKSDFHRFHVDRE